MTAATPAQPAHPLDLAAMAVFAVNYGLNGDQAARRWATAVKNVREHWRMVADAAITAGSLTTPARPADVSPHLGCAVCASGVTVPHGAGGTPGQAAYPLQSAVSALQRLADKTPMGNWDEPEPAEVALRRDYAQAALDEIAVAAQEPHAAPGLAEVLSSPAELARWVEVNHGDHPEWVDELRALLPASEQPAPGLAIDLDADVTEEQAAEIRKALEAVNVTRAAVAPELAAAMRESRVRAEVITDILAAFGPSGSGHTARVGQVQIAKWRTRAGLTS